MAFCSKCGTQLNDGAKFCPKCGNPTGSTQKESSSTNFSNCSIELLEAGAARLVVVKALVDELGISINDAKALVASTPCVIAEGLSLSRAKELAKIFAATESRIAVKQNGKTIFVEEPPQNVDSQTEEQGGNKFLKYGGYVLGALCFFYILGTCEGGSSDSQEETQTEQKQESQAERQARENEERKSQFAEQKKEVKERGYKAGYEDGFTVGPATYATTNPKQSAKTYFTTYYGAPMSDEEKSLCDIFVENYIKGYEEGHRNQ